VTIPGRGRRTRPAVRYGSGNICFSHSMSTEWPDLVRDNLLHRDVQSAERLVGEDHFLVAVRRVFEYRAPADQESELVLVSGVQ
jgi:hypothetical protein